VLFENLAVIQVLVVELEGIVNDEDIALGLHFVMIWDYNWDSLINFESAFRKLAVSQFLEVEGKGCSSLRLGS